MEKLVSQIASIFTIGTEDQRILVSSAALDAQLCPEEKFTKELRKIFLKSLLPEATREQLSALRTRLFLDMFGSEQEQQRRSLVMIIDLWCEHDADVIYDNAEWFVELLANQPEALNSLSKAVRSVA